MLDLKTEKQKRRLQLHHDLAEEYCDIVRDEPDAAPYRVMTVLAEKHDLSLQGVSVILRKMGVYEPKKKD